MAFAPQCPRNDMKPPCGLSQIAFTRNQETVLNLRAADARARMRTGSGRFPVVTISALRPLRLDSHVVRLRQQRRLEINKNVAGCD